MYSEVIKRLGELKAHCEAMKSIDECADYEMYIKAIDTAVNALGKGVKNGRQRTGKNSRKASSVA